MSSEILNASSRNNNPSFKIDPNFRFQSKIVINCVDKGERRCSGPLMISFKPPIEKDTEPEQKWSLSPKTKNTKFDLNTFSKEDMMKINVLDIESDNVYKDLNQSFFSDPDDLELFMKKEKSYHDENKLKYIVIRKKIENLKEAEKNKEIYMQKLKKRFPHLAFKLKRVHLNADLAIKRIKKFEKENEKMEKEMEKEKELILITPRKEKKKFSIKEKGMNPTPLFRKVGADKSLEILSFKNILYNSTQTRNFIDKSNSKEFVKNICFTSDSNNEKQRNYESSNSTINNYESFYTPSALKTNELNITKKNLNIRKALFPLSSSTKTLVSIKVPKSEVFGSILKQCEYMANANSIFSKQIKEMKND
jgi:hypothetical protein